MNRSPPVCSMRHTSRVRRSGAQRSAPAPLLSGHHAQIERWRREQALLRTARERPDLIAAARAGGRLDGRDEKFLREIAQGAGGVNPPAVLDPSSAAARTAEQSA